MDDIVRALAVERASYMRAGRPERCISVDEQLAIRGYCVDKAGDLVKLEERKPERPRKERAPQKAPERAVDEG